MARGSNHSSAQTHRLFGDQSQGPDFSLRLEAVAGLILKSKGPWYGGASNMGCRWDIMFRVKP